MLELDLTGCNSNIGHARLRIETISLEVVEKAIKRRRGWRPD